MLILDDSKEDTFFCLYGRQKCETCPKSCEGNIQGVPILKSNFPYEEMCHYLLINKSTKVQNPTIHCIKTETTNPKCVQCKIKGRTLTEISITPKAQFSFVDG